MMGTQIIGKFLWGSTNNGCAGTAAKAQPGFCMLLDLEGVRQDKVLAVKLQVS